MGRSLIGLCMMVFGTIGSFVPEVWGASSFSLSSVLFGGVGAVAGVFVGVRLSSL